MKPKSVRMNIDTGEKTWLTPPHIIEALGPFDLDPCCPPTMPWRTATRMVHWPEDGLKVDWTGKRVWCNPPYGREAVPFLRKMAKNKTGGAFCYISPARILPCGTTSYSRTPAAFYSFAGASSSAVQTERQQTRLPRPLRSSRTRSKTLCVSARAGSKGAFCVSNHPVLCRASHGAVVGMIPKYSTLRSYSQKTRKKNSPFRKISNPLLIIAENQKKSDSPIFYGVSVCFLGCLKNRELVGAEGFEPAILAKCNPPLDNAKNP